MALKQVKGDDDLMRFMGLLEKALRTGRTRKDIEHLRRDFLSLKEQFDKQKHSNEQIGVVIATLKKDAEIAANNVSHSLEKQKWLLIFVAALACGDLLVHNNSLSFVAKLLGG